MTMLVLLVLCLLPDALSWSATPLPRTLARFEALGLQRRTGGFAAAAAVLVALPKMSLAAAGAVQKASLEETQAAARELLAMAKQVEEMEKLGAKGDWESVAAILSTKPFLRFDQTANVLVRSDSISAEDKVALGTIKRYGVVADAIIMMGGLGAVLRAGGVKGMAAAPSGYADQKAIVDDEADLDSDDDSPKQVNAAEAIKYIKLFKGSLADINRIVGTSKVL